MKIKEYYSPGTLEEAYEILCHRRGTIIGGGAFLNLTSKNIESAVDLSRLKLNYISENDECIEIGAMTTLMEIETSSILKQNLDGLLPCTASKIMGVQVRNMATIGGTVSGKYGFSDLLSSLMVLDTRVELYKGGIQPIGKYLFSKTSDDIITKVIIKKEKVKTYFTCIKNAAMDFSILNAAVSRCGNTFRICVGARPYIAVRVSESEASMSSSPLNEGNTSQAAQIASEVLQFGSDLRGSATYRRELCKVLVKRSIMEVIL